MVANSLVHPAYAKRPALLTRLYLNLRYPKMDWLPRRDIFASILLLLAGFSIAGAMCLGLLPLSFALAFLGLALAAIGGAMVLICCGEI
jgi:hypothetical protein